MTKRFSWIIPHKLAVGSFPTSPLAIAYLRRSGITAVLSLTEESEKPISPEIFYSYVWERVAIPDGFKGGIPTEAQFATAVQVLTRWHQKGHVIYVHCLAGVGRSPSVCVAYLVKTQGMTFKQALTLVKKQHPDAAPDPEQIKIMLNFFNLEQDESIDVVEMPRFEQY